MQFPPGAKYRIAIEWLAALPIVDIEATDPLWQRAWNLRTRAAPHRESFPGTYPRDSRADELYGSVREDFHLQMILDLLQRVLAKEFEPFSCVEVTLVIGSDVREQ